MHGNSNIKKKIKSDVNETGEGVGEETRLIWLRIQTNPGLV